MSTLKDITAFIGEVIEYRRRINSVVEQRYKEIHKDRSRLLSDDSVAHLLLQCYYASLHTDEGRQTRFALTWFHPGVSPTPSVSFNPRIALANPKTLVKLSQMVPPASSLQVTEGSPPVLECVYRYEYLRPVERAEHHRWRNSTFLTSTLRVHSPGHISIQEGSLRFELNKGVVNKLRNYFDNALVKKWLNDARKSLFQELGWGDRLEPPNVDAIKAEPNWQHEWWQFEYQNLHLRGLIGWILGSIVEAGHGGAIAVLGPGDASQHISYSYDCHSGLRSAIATAWQRHLQQQQARCEYGKHHDSLKSQIPATLNLCFEPSSFYELESVLAALSATSNLDGIVALDRELQLRGIGGVIRANIDVEKTSIMHVNRSQQVQAADVLQGKGTRHRSAMALCAAIPNTLVFVISQDGTLRLFASDDNMLYYEEMLTAKAE